MLGLILPLRNIWERAPRYFINCWRVLTAIIGVLCTLVSLNDWIENFTQETRKCSQETNNSMHQSSVFKCSAGKVKCSYFDWLVKNHFEAIVHLGTIKFAKKKLFLTCAVLHWLSCWPDDFNCCQHRRWRLLIFRSSTIGRSFPLVLWEQTLYFCIF